MEAERDKRAQVTQSTGQREAQILLSEGQRESAINVSEGERQEAVNLSEGEMRRRINEAEGRAAEIRALAEASAESIRLVAEAIGKPGGRMAVQMQLVEQFINELGEILRSAKVSVVPAGLANIKGFFEGLARVGTEVGGGSPAVPPKPGQPRR